MLSATPALKKPSTGRETSQPSCELDLRFYPELQRDRVENLRWLTLGNKSACSGGSFRAASVTRCPPSRPPDWLDLDPVGLSGELGLDPLRLPDWPDRRAGVPDWLGLSAVDLTGLDWLGRRPPAAPSPADSAPPSFPFTPPPPPAPAPSPAPAPAACELRWVKPPAIPPD